jgi:predicted nucleotidyltransferase
MREDKRAEAVAPELAGRLREHLGGHLKRVVLFGSRARGDASADADYDCLVVVDEVSRAVTDAIDEAAWEMLRDRGAVVSAIPVTEERLRRRRWSPLLMNIREEGITL